jgi:hypothetical protein
MTSETSMTQARFAALAQAYGGRLERWPEAWRASAGDFARSAEGQAALAEAAGLDTLLDTYATPPFSAALIGRIIAPAASRLTLQRRLRRWWLGVGFVGIGLAGGLAGAVTIVAMMPNPEPRWALPAGTLTAFGAFQTDPESMPDAP